MKQLQLKWLMLSLILSSFLPVNAIRLRSVKAVGAISGAGVLGSLGLIAYHRHMLETQEATCLPRASHCDPTQLACSSYGNEKWCRDRYDCISQQRKLALAGSSMALMGAAIAGGLYYLTPKVRIGRALNRLTQANSYNPLRATYASPIDFVQTVEREHIASTWPWSTHNNGVRHLAKSRNNALSALRLAAKAQADLDPEQTEMAEQCKKIQAQAARHVNYSNHLLWVLKSVPDFRSRNTGLKLDMQQYESALEPKTWNVAQEAFHKNK